MQATQEATVRLKSPADLDLAAVFAALPGATPETARAIVAARPLESVDGLSRVKGITTEQLEQIRAAVVVQPAKLPAP